MGTEAERILERHQRASFTGPFVVGHEGHHEHLRGRDMECSCGQFLGTACGGIGEGDLVPYCEICGEPGVATLVDRQEDGQVTVSWAE